MKWLRWLRWKVTAKTRWGRQTCAGCYRHGGEAIWFHVPDTVWADIMDASQEVLCLYCFDLRAEVRRIDYGATIEIQGRGSWLVGLQAAADARSV